MELNLTIGLFNESIPNRHKMIDNKKATTTQPLEWQQALCILYTLKGKHDLKNLMLFGLGFYTAYRVGDILSLKWSDITGEKIVLIEAKTGKRRVAYLNQQFCELRDWVISQYDTIPKGYIFRYDRKGVPAKPMSVTAANKRIKQVLTDFGIQGKKSSHVLRKTWSRAVYMSNPTDYQLTLLSQALNHSSTRITRRYIGLTEDNIREAYLSLPTANRKYKKAG